MQEEILDSPLRNANQKIRTRLIKGLEVLSGVAFILLIMGAASAFAWHNQDPEGIRSLMISSVLFLCLPAYAIWFRKKSLEFDADASIKTFEFSTYSKITRIVCLALGVIFLVMALVIPYLVINKDPKSSLLVPFYGLAIFYFFFAGSLSALFLSYPILTKKRVDKILKG